MLIAVVAALAAVVSYPARIAMERNAARQNTSGYVFFDDGLTYDAVPSDGAIPKLRKLFGDSATVDIALPVTTTAAERKRIAELFPEAKIWAYRPPFDAYIEFSGPTKRLHARLMRQFFPFPDDGSTGEPK